MGVSDWTENGLLNLIFSAQAWSGYADAATAGETNIAVGLHTDDPGDIGNMSTSEVTYTGYLRVNVPRPGGWTVATAGSVSPVSQIDFPVGTGGGGSVTHFSTGRTGGGPAPILWSGTVTPPIPTGAAVSPHLIPATLITID